MGMQDGPFIMRWAALGVALRALQTRIMHHMQKLVSAHIHTYIKYVLTCLQTYLHVCAYIYIYMYITYHMLIYTHNKYTQTHYHTQYTLPNSKGHRWSQGHVEGIFELQRDAAMLGAMRSRRFPAASCARLRSFVRVRSVRVTTLGLLTVGAAKQH